MALDTETTRTGYPHIVVTPGTCGGRPRIEGTRLSVEWVVKQIATGDTPADIVKGWNYISEAAIHSALAYYYDHKAEMDADIEFYSLDKQIERGEISIDEKGVVTFLLRNTTRGIGAHQQA